MITRITLDNIDTKGGREEYVAPEKLLINQNSTAEEWDEFGRKVWVIKKVKELFQNHINLFSNFEQDNSRESTLEIQVKEEDKIYTYSLVFYESQLVMESLLEGKSWIFSRFSDNPDFALNPSYLNEKGKEIYQKYKQIFPICLLYCFKPGVKILREIRNIIVVDDWMKFRHLEFIKQFESTFPGLSYNNLMNEMIKTYFPEDYDGLEKDNQTLRLAHKPKLKIELELAGSGFIRLSRLFPLMVASKTEKLMMIATEPYDLSLHPILGRALMKWFLKDNSNPPIGKLSNIEL